MADQLEHYPPKDHIVERAHLNSMGEYERQYRLSLDDPEAFWAKQADRILIAPGLPKTRSGKIMRRILRRIAAGKYEDMSNVTTLADPDVVDALVAAHKEK